MTINTSLINESNIENLDLQLGRNLTDIERLLVSLAIKYREAEERAAEELKECISDIESQLEDAFKEGERDLSIRVRCAIGDSEYDSPEAKKLASDLIGILL